MRKLLFVGFVLILATGASQALAGTHPGPGTLHAVATIAIPGNALKNFDISAFSDAQDVYGFSDRSNLSVDLIDAATDRFAGHVKGFSHGPNGLVSVGDDQFWAGDAGSKLRVVDIRARKIIATIDTGGKERVDELAYDPRNRVIIAVNNDDQPPFVSFVSTAPGHRIVGKLYLPQATDGLEQPLWNPGDGMLYLSVPTLKHHKEDGGIAVIDPAKHQLTGMIRVQQCMPAGLALGPNDHLLVGCSDDAVAAGFAPRSLIIDLHARKVVATIRQVGGSDEVWYGSGSGHYYLAAVANTGGPVLGVIDARRDVWLENVPTGKRAHSVATDPSNGQVFVPIAANEKIKGCSNGCVEVFDGK